MKKLFIILVLLTFGTNIIFAQKVLYDDIICPNEGAKGNASVTYTYWNKTNLYYYFKNYDCNLSSAQSRVAIQNAFNTWSQYSLFTFIETNNLSQADFEISWEETTHSGCNPFSTYALAHASIGKYNRTPPAYIHFRKDITFTMTSSEYSLEAVALHEIGHVLGLEHNLNNSNAVMYPSYTYKTDLTFYDYSALYSIYGFPSSIDGPHLICSVDTFSIDNIDKLPSNFTVSWSISDSYYNNGYNLLIPNCPSKGHCLIVRDQNHDMKNATLTAAIKKGNDTIRILQKADINAYDDFWGQYTSGNLSGEINYTHIFGVKANYTTTVTSPNFYGATVTYDSSGATPTAWGFNSSTSVLNFKAPAGIVPVVINVVDGCSNQYTLYAFPSSSYSMNVSYGDNSITITLNENGDPETGLTLDQPWKVEISNATTGELMTTRSSTSRSATISTAGWPKGMYVVRVTVGKEVLTEKVVVK